VTPAGRRDLVLTIDGGGSAVKAGVVAPDGRLLSLARRETEAIHRGPRLAELDPDAWLAAAVEAAHDAVAAAGAPASAYRGITGCAMRIPFVLVGAAGEPVAPGVLNLDDRGAPFLDEVREALGPDRLYRLTGHWPNAQLGLPKLLWFARTEPAVWARVRRVLQLHDWLLYRLCGVAASEPSSASMGQLLEVAARAWATELLDRLGIEPALFPPLHDAGCELGGLDGRFADAIGLAAGTPVHVGGGDTHVAALGAGGAVPGRIAVVAGSTTPLQLAAAEPRTDPESAPLVSAHLRPGLWALETNPGLTGMAYTWLARLRRELGGGGDGYGGLDALAARAPLGANGLLVTAGNPGWGEEAWRRVPPLAVVNLSPRHTAGDLARATLECSCYAVGANLAPLEALAGRREPIVLTGGASRSELYAQMLADVLDRAVEVPAAPEPALLGGARLVLGDGALAAPPPPRLYSPEPERHRRYREHAERYAATFDALRPAA
jgi:sugar (pentulose or hexulose) kinase